MPWKPKYKQVCAICRKNHVLIVQRNQFPICTSCSMKQINQPIENATFRKMFDIDQKLYEGSSFLRSRKSNYLRFGSLSDKQIETFKRVAEEMKNPAAKKETPAPQIEEKEEVKVESKPKPKAKPKKAKPKK